MPRHDSRRLPTEGSQEASCWKSRTAHLLRRLKSTSSSALLRAETLGESMGETLGVFPCDWLGVCGRSSDGAGQLSLPGCLIQYVNPCREHPRLSTVKRMKRSTALLAKMAA